VRRHLATTAAPNAQVDLPPAVAATHEATTAGVALEGQDPDVVVTIAAAPVPVVGSGVTVVGTSAVDQGAGLRAVTHGLPRATPSKVGPRTARTVEGAVWLPRARACPSRASRTR
jgi:tetrahydromethanopterin S-methyltransferase subunit E